MSLVYDFKSINSYLERRPEKKKRNLPPGWKIECLIPNHVLVNINGYVYQYPRHGMMPNHWFFCDEYGNRVDEPIGTEELME